MEFVDGDGNLLRDGSLIIRYFSGVLHEKDRYLWGLYHYCFIESDLSPSPSPQNATKEMPSSPLFARNSMQSSNPIQGNPARVYGLADHISPVKTERKTLYIPVVPDFMSCYIPRSVLLGFGIGLTVLALQRS